MSDIALHGTVDYDDTTAVGIEVGDNSVARHNSVHYGHYHAMFSHPIQGERYHGKWGREARKQRGERKDRSSENSREGRCNFTAWLACTERSHCFVGLPVQDRDHEMKEEKTQGETRQR